MPTYPISGKLWIVQLCENLSRHVYRTTKYWPKLEKDYLVEQWRHSTDSIGVNISEGYARTHTKERLHFYSLAQGSLEESLYWLRRARDRRLVSEQQSSMLSELFIKLARALENFIFQQGKGR